MNIIKLSLTTKEHAIRNKHQHKFDYQDRRKYV